MTLALDLKEFTIDGEPIQRLDIVMLLAEYHYKHPEDKMASDIVAYIHSYALQNME